MATFALLPGAGSGPWYWHLVEQELQALGHRTVAVDLPCDDDAAGLPEYAEAAVAAIGDRFGADVHDLAVVAHSLGGFTGPLVCDRLPARLLSLVTAMVPRPGESVGEWFGASGIEEAQRRLAEAEGLPTDRPLTDAEVYYADVPADLAATLEAEAAARGQSGTPFGQPWPLDAWPDVPTRYVLCTGDRFLPAELVRRVLAERLPHVVPDELDAGHLPMLARPGELAATLHRQWLGRSAG